jgi:hypothetical protein
MRPCVAITWLQRCARCSWMTTPPLVLYAPCNAPGPRFEKCFLRLTCVPESGGPEGSTWLDASHECCKAAAAVRRFAGSTINRRQMRSLALRARGRSGPQAGEQRQRVRSGRQIEYPSNWGEARHGMRSHRAPLPAAPARAPVGDAIPHGVVKAEPALANLLKQHRLRL